MRKPTRNKKVDLATLAAHAEADRAERIAERERRRVRRERDRQRKEGHR